VIGRDPIKKGIYGNKNGVSSFGKDFFFGGVD
jgi:hypothetical protein